MRKSKTGVVMLLLLLLLLMLKVRGEKEMRSEKVICDLMIDNWIFSSDYLEKGDFMVKKSC